MIITNDNIKAVAEAIQSLVPNAVWTNTADGAIDWMDDSKTQPTDSAIEAEMTRLQAAYDSQEYARTRKVKYDLLNQDEMRYDDLKNSTTTWVDAIDAIKAAHPKP
jgi:hypothetical protein